MREHPADPGSGFVLGALVGGSIGSVFGPDPALAAGLLGAAVGFLLIPPFEGP